MRIFITFVIFCSVSVQASLGPLSPLDEHWSKVGLAFSELAPAMNTETCYSKERVFSACVLSLNAYLLFDEKPLELRSDISYWNASQQKSPIVDFGPILVVPKSGLGANTEVRSRKFPLQESSQWEASFREARVSKINFEEVFKWVQARSEIKKNESLATAYALNAWYGVLYGEHAQVVPESLWTEQTTILDWTTSKVSKRIDGSPDGVQTIGFEFLDGPSRAAMIRVSNLDKKDACQIVSGLAEIIEADNDRPDKSPVSGLVLDLRSAHGTKIDQAVCIARLFLRPGQTIATKIENHGFLPNFTWFATAKPVTELPLVVLTNWATRGTAEVISAALQDNSRAWIIGQKSMGFGNINLEKNISDKARLKLPIGHYLRPSGIEIQYLGVTPDFTVSEGEQKSIPRLRVADYYTFVPKVGEWTQTRKAQIDKIQSELTSSPLIAPLDAGIPPLREIELAVEVIRSIHKGIRP